MKDKIITTETPLYDKFLLKKCQTVASITDEILRQLLNLKNKLLMIGGAGLAAPQIGIGNRIIVCSFNRDKNIQEMINPTYIPANTKQTSCWEGCYSVPLTACKIQRWETIDAEYHNVKNEHIKIQLEGPAARIFQHECDHLNGILIISKALETKKFDSWDKLREFLFNKDNLI